MKITVDNRLFKESFKAHGRRNQFSDEALNYLFDYYEELDESCGMETELDVIAICCDWTEYWDEELIDEYGYLLEDEVFDDDADDEDRVEAIINGLGDLTTIMRLPGSVVVENF